MPISLHCIGVVYVSWVIYLRSANGTKKLPCYSNNQYFSMHFYLERKFQFLLHFNLRLHKYPEDDHLMFSNILIFLIFPYVPSIEFLWCITSVNKLPVSDKYKLINTSRILYLLLLGYYEKWNSCMFSPMQEK